MTPEQKQTLRALVEDLIRAYGSSQHNIGRPGLGPADQDVRDETERRWHARLDAILADPIQPCQQCGTPTPLDLVTELLGGTCPRCGEYVSRQ